jgi:F-type H+-transporting ATPase subunit b
MQILNNFGFEWTLFAAQIVNFLVIFFLLKKFLYKPMLKMLDDRKHTIAQGLKHAEEADKRLQETIEKEEKVLRTAQEEAKRMIDEAKMQQASIMQNTEEQTKARVETMLQEAREQIEFETTKVEKRLTAHVSRLAIQFLQQSSQELFGPTEQEAIIKNAVKKLKDKRAD